MIKAKLLEQYVPAVLTSRKYSLNPTGETGVSSDRWRRLIRNLLASDDLADRSHVAS